MAKFKEAVEKFLDENPDYRYTEKSRFQLRNYLTEKIGLENYSPVLIEPMLREIGKERNIDYIQE